MPPPPLITVQGLTKSFRPGRGLWEWLDRTRKRSLPVLRGIHLEVGPGEVFGLVGPNGAGKTTLLKILSTLVLPDRGAAQIDGLDVVRQASEVRRRLGVILESERNFYARLSGRQNLEFFAALYELEGRRARQRIGELLERVELVEAGDRPFIQYSLGMQHRLGLARALLPNPSVLLLDEPTRSLDPITARALRGLLRTEIAAQGTTILLASHSLDEVEELCDRLAVLDRGRLVAQGSRQELAQQFQCATLEELYQKAVGQPEGAERA